MYTHLKSLTNNFEIKFSAFFETFENASSSKSYLPMVTFVIVSMSVEPMNGDNPDNLVTAVIQHDIKVEKKKKERRPNANSKSVKCKLFIQVCLFDQRTVRSK